MTSVLVTGGAGFIGSHVTDAFLAAGSSVTVLDDLSSGKRENVPHDAAFVQESIGSAAAATLILDGGFDIIIHCAAQMDVRRSVADPVHDATSNIIGTLNLLEVVRSGSKRSRVIFTSTGGALYGDFTVPPNLETFDKDPESPYGISKLAGEHYLTYYGSTYGLEPVVLRLGNVYGPRQDPHGEAGVVAIFCGRILRGEPLTIFGSGEQARDYVYVGDVVRAVQLAATRELPPKGRLDARAFNIGTGEATSVNDLARLLQKTAGSSVSVVYAPARPGEQMTSFLDAGKAAGGLGWKPLVALEEGLGLTFEWFAARAKPGAASG
ncbi:MAG TPA: NAD-dependent epimerase/dehydratase family protein [Gemmatimonadaceae bacterium]|nr:NAD-dependent epimerase/dehydratase family protein [Gemmatimonadaceae bacterium]